MSLAIAAVFAYLASASGLFLRLFNKLHKYTGLFIGKGVVAICLHLGYLFSAFDLTHQDTYSLFLVCNIFALFGAALVMAFYFFSKNLFAVPMVLLFTSIICSGNFFVLPSAESNAHWSLENFAHISLALFSYGVLTLATVLTYQYSFLANRLKHHDLSVLALPMPSLNSIEHQIIGLLKLGCLCLFISIFTGFIFMEDFWGSGQAHKTILSILAFMLFISVIIGHQKQGWRGRIVVSLTTIGISLLTVGYFGSRFIREVVLQAA
ncbi:cytochrome c assembly protein [Catenovulum agarivorans DS-2]|uniref:Cytochrome c assembly protein n=1 Tax=Catenovulum agarivorans DS-2 TaxID=1328313 RepID=W7QTX7_9ALTE|nr:cytochrome c biogenesis protein CcsA [Catenovulum agarivorans]EWH11293.1 cytochrome c assembly protein [Catenovulum agarivorans DS-2]